MPRAMVCEDKENLCGWLCRFVPETRKANGSDYTPISIYIPVPCNIKTMLPLLNASNTNIPNIVITGCDFTNCNVSLYSKVDNNENATSTNQ